MSPTKQKKNKHFDFIYDELMALKESDYWKFVSTKLKGEIDIFLAQNKRAYVAPPSHSESFRSSNRKADPS